jgi:phosphatidate cytidylyltransferase
MLGWRVAASAILVPLLAAVFYFDHRSGPSAPWLLALVLLLAARCAWELCELLGVRSFRPSFPLAALGAGAVAASSWAWLLMPEGSSPGAALGVAMLVYGGAVLLLLASNAARYRQPGSSMETLGAELLVVSYVGVLLCLTAQLRWVAGPRAGYLVLGSLIVAAKCGDIGAYTLGRLIGRRKMAPRLSPGKTWAGAAGALVGSALGAWAWLVWAPPFFDRQWQAALPVPSIAYGAIIGIAGLVGDLCESLIKRDLGKKDAADLLPGFGGLLDLLDSVLYAGPIAYVLWLVFPPATWTP